MRLASRVLAAVALAAAPALAQDVVLQWNLAALNAIRADGTPPPSATRDLAMLHGAVFDAVNGIVRKYEHYLVPPNAASNASRDAAASAAAHDILVVLHPNHVAVFDALHASVLAAIDGEAAKQLGAQWGASVAQQMHAARANDGSANSVSYPGSTTPGLWRPTISFGGVVRPALLPQWGGVTPFVITSGTAYRPPAPPPLPTLLYAVEVLITQAIGELNSTVRTPEQTQIAQFWGYGPRTATPPGHWNQVATVVAMQSDSGVLENARLFALLNLAMADVSISCWECKYEFGYWRPITAIQLADQDGNPFTVPDPDWMPLLETPPFPEYTSGHSTFSGAAATVLARFFGRDDIAFTVGSDDLPGVLRSYRSFSEAAWESGLSRIYGGIHFLSANFHGLSGGYEIASYVCDNALQGL